MVVSIYLDERFPADIKSFDVVEYAGIPFVVEVYWHPLTCLKVVEYVGMAHNLLGVVVNVGTLFVVEHGNHLRGKKEVCAQRPQGCSCVMLIGCRSAPIIAGSFMRAEFHLTGKGIARAWSL